MKLPENSIKVFLKKSNILDDVLKKYKRMRLYAKENDYTEKEFGQFGDTEFMYLRYRYSESITQSLFKLSEYGFYNTGNVKHIPTELWNITWEVLEPKLDKIKKEIPLRTD